MKGEQAAKDETGKYSKAAEWGDRCEVHFAGIRHIEQFLHFRNIDNGWDGKEGNGK